ncbi:methionine--tRNA ligase [Candidatus Woesearchaeota archaeon]|nr:methionine--tRNA ligase [Candidatus Woesearchaeota archaeon]
MAEKRKIVVTSALPYANGSIHIGHLVEYIQTDMFVRFLKLTGEDAIYCCADDTHGTPIELKAEEMGISPEELIKKYHKEHLKDFRKFLISFDSYYTTNSAENKEFSDKIFNELKKKGYIYTKEIEVTWCPNCNRSLPDRYVKGKCPRCGAEDQYGDVCEKCNATYTTVELVDPYCTICKSTPERKPSMHYFFKLNMFGAKLDDWLTKNRNLQPEIVNYVRNWIKEGLQDWDISRDGPYFGFKIPGEDDKYYYVWLDAPVGYVASTANYCKKEGCDAEKDYWKSKKGRIIHFIGKDIIYFHFLFWPAMLMGAGFNLPESIYVHGFLTVNGEKMSKSRGTFFTASDFAEKYNPEYLRYYFAKMLSRKMSDIDLDFADFEDSVNNELVANLGNFCYRVLSFLNKNFEGKVNDIDENKKLIEEIMAKVKRIRSAYDDINTKEAVKEIMAISDLGNRYFQEKEPWKMIKKDEQEAHRVLGLCVNIVKILSILISPVLPKFAEELQKQLKAKDVSWDDINFRIRDHEVESEKILIEKVEIAEEQKFPLDLRVAKILDARQHPNADKLLILEIDAGEKRQLVAGLKKWYKPEDLKGKKTIIVANLKPAKLRGELSQGMILAADDGKNVGLLTVEKARPGDSANFGELKNNTSQVTFEEFERIRMKVMDGKAFYKDKELRAREEKVRIDSVQKGTLK